MVDMVEIFMLGLNVWFEFFGFKGVVVDYYVEVLLFVCRMVKFFVEVFKFFFLYFDEFVLILGVMGCLIYYLLQKVFDLDVLGIGVYIDIEFFIIFVLGIVLVLQIFNVEGEWIQVFLIFGIFVVNIGDMLVMWINDYFVSIVYCVWNVMG